MSLLKNVRENAKFTCLWNCSVIPWYCEIADIEEFFWEYKTWCYLICLEEYQLGYLKIIARLVKIGGYFSVEWRKSEARPVQAGGEALWGHQGLDHTLLSGPPSTRGVHCKKPGCCWSIRNCIPVHRKEEGPRKKCSFSLRTLYTHRIYIGFHLPLMGQSLAATPHLAAKEAGKWTLYYMYPGFQPHQQFCCQEGGQEYIFKENWESLQ